MSSAVSQKFRSGKAARNSLANFFTSSRPRRGACIEYSKRVSGAASSSTTDGFHGLPQNSVNQRPTMDLFCADMMISFRAVNARRRVKREVDPSCELTTRIDDAGVSGLACRWDHEIR